MGHTDCIRAKYVLPHNLFPYDREDLFDGDIITLFAPIRHS